MNEDIKNFADLLGSLIAKYAEKIDLDSLPDIPKCQRDGKNIDSLPLSLAF